MKTCFAYQFWNFRLFDQRVACLHFSYSIHIHTWETGWTYTCWKAQNVSFVCLQCGCFLFYSAVAMLQATHFKHTVVWGIGLGGFCSLILEFEQQIPPRGEQRMKLQPMEAAKGSWPKVGYSVSVASKIHETHHSVLNDSCLPPRLHQAVCLGGSHRRS